MAKTRCVGEVRLSAAIRQRDEPPGLIRDAATG